MCLTYCHQRHSLFDSDADDVCGVCQFNRRADLGELSRAEQSCEVCQHRQGGVCALTRARLPALRWCCHCNANVQIGLQRVVAENVLDLLRRQPLEDVLKLYGADYMVERGAFFVSLESLSVPLVYGVPVEHWIPALIGEHAGDDVTPQPVEWDWSRLL